MGKTKQGAVIPAPIKPIIYKPIPRFGGCKNC